MKLPILLLILLGQVNAQYKSELQEPITPITEDEYQKEKDKLNNEYAHGIYEDNHKFISKKDIERKIFNENKICDLIWRYESVHFLIDRIKKDKFFFLSGGISNSSVNTLKDSMSYILINNLYKYAIRNKPLKKGSCSFCVGIGDISGISSIELNPAYKLVQYIEYVLDENPNLRAYLDREILTKTWRKSVLANTKKISEKCNRDLEYIENYPEILKDKDIDFRDYMRGCKIINRALGEGLQPNDLQITSETAVKLFELYSK